jgi:hypothetical protein
MWACLCGAGLAQNHLAVLAGHGSHPFPAPHTLRRPLGRWLPRCLLQRMGLLHRWRAMFHRDFRFRVLNFAFRDEFLLSGFLLSSGDEGGLRLVIGGVKERLSPQGGRVGEGL